MHGMRDAIVIGGGLSGLSAAWELRRRGADVIVLELLERPGGVMIGERREGFLIEHGPSEMMLKNASMEAQIQALGLGEELQRPSANAQRRYIVRDGRPVALPQNPLSGVFNPILSLRGKLGLASEWLRGKGVQDDESVAAFVRRRLGQDFLDYAVGPLCSGIYAGDPEQLSMRHAFPVLWNLEKQYGGMIRGAIGKMRERRAAGTPAYIKQLVSFRGGMRSLPDAIAASLGEVVICKARVKGVSQDAGGWTLDYEREGRSYCERARKLVIAVPAYELAHLPLPAAIQDTLSPLASLPYSPVATVFTGFRREDIAHALDGFGVLVPRKESRGLIGTLFLSSLFEGRAPEGCVALLSFVGGMYSPQYARLDALALCSLVREELGRLLGARAVPLVEQAHHWPKAIPNFPVGYQAMLDSLDLAEQRWPGLSIVGNYRGGPAAGDSMMAAINAAARLLARD